MEETITLSVSDSISESVTNKVLAEKSFVFPHYSIEIIGISYDCSCYVKLKSGYSTDFSSESAVSTGTKIGVGETQTIWSGSYFGKGSVSTQVYLKILDNKNTAITVNSTNNAEYTSEAYINNITVKFVGLV